VQRSDLGEEWVYNTPFYLLINLAIGGTYVGYPSEDEVFPKDLIVDYVRIYTHGSNKKINEK
jgi:beta-glucanase (GH16 family)